MLNAKQINSITPAFTGKLKTYEVKKYGGIYLPPLDR